MNSVHSRSPRPIPNVFLAETPFSHRKRTPSRAHPPRSPAKSCPPASRVFHTPRHHTKDYKPQFVSFKSEQKAPLVSPLYDEQSQKSFFEQCFDVIEKLGEGSFGEVFKVRSKEDGQLYAVKRSRQRFRGDLDRKQKLAEVEKHENLPPHPNCVSFLRAWEERQHLYIQTELCKMSLSEYADLQGQVSETEVWRILVDLLQGLKHLHNNRLCHFDIKPANIFVGMDGQTFKLGDFGLCISLDQGFTNALEGDAKYMASELMRGEFGMAADIFSLGISILEIACNLELPSGGPNWQMLRKGELPLDFTRDLSPELTNLLMRMMNPVSSMRPTVDEILKDYSVRKAKLQSTCHWMLLRTAAAMVAVCRPFYTLILLLIHTLFRGDSAKATPPSIHTVHSKHNESFSDEDEEIRELLSHYSEDSMETPNNLSFIQRSPVKYPTPIYQGPPIPLTFDLADPSDTSLEGSSIASSPHRPHPHTSLLESSHASQDSSLSCTPSTKPSMDEAIHLKGLSIGPKNLMDAFEATD
ncbi:hypothetical protein EMCRGX_G023667 [Ephydatia muelleri]